MLKILDDIILVKRDPLYIFFKKSKEKSSDKIRAFKKNIFKNYCAAAKLFKLEIMFSAVD